MTIRTIPAPRAAILGPRPLLPARVAGRLPLFGRDLALLLTVVAVYFLLRGLAPERTGFAMQLSEGIVAFERRGGFFFEPAIQDASIRVHAIQELANFTYAYLHFPVLGAIAAWLWWKDRVRYAFVRNVFFVSMAVGLVFYYLLPAAPPRLLALHGLDLGFTDTVFGGDTAVHYAQPSFILNEYAAIPSFHFGWIALAAAAVWANTGNRAARTGAVALVVLMTWAIVASANHFFVDMALGGIVIAASWQAVRRFAGRATRERRPAPRRIRPRFAAPPDRTVERPAGVVPSPHGAGARWRVPGGHIWCPIAIQSTEASSRWRVPRAGLSGHRRPAWRAGDVARGSVRRSPPGTIVRHSRQPLAPR